MTKTLLETNFEMLALSILLLALAFTFLLPSSSSSTTAYAQDDEDEEEDEDENIIDEEDIEELEEKDEEQHAEESEEWMKQSQESIEAKINETQLDQEEIKKTLNDLLLGNTSLSPLFLNPYANVTAVVDAVPEPPEPILNLTGDHILNPIPVVVSAEEQESLNLNCNCTTNNTETLKRTQTPPPSLQPPLLSQSQPPTQVVEEQIIIPTDSLKSMKATGEITDQAYTDFYHVRNVLDNTINEFSYWSQYGVNAGFNIHLAKPIKDYEVCSVKINSANPKNIPFTLNIGSSGKNYTGIIDETVEKITLDKCVKNVNKISMSFDAIEKYISIAELELFGIKTPSPLPELEPAEDKDQQVINITDSTATINIRNSTVTFSLDANSIIQQGQQR